MTDYRLIAEPGHIGLVANKQVPLKCGRCSNRTFSPIVEPNGHQARVTGLECTKCSNHWAVDTHGYLNTTGEITVEHGAKGNGSVQ